MTGRSTVDCCVEYAKSTTDPQFIRFNIGRELALRLEGDVGPDGLSAAASDLLDLGAAVFQIERQFRSKSVGNPPVRIRLSMKLRDPKTWSQDALNTLAAILSLLGNAVWDIKLLPGLRQRAYGGKSDRKANQVSQIALLSGGLDSTCGALTLTAETDRTQVVSFYSVQKKLQSNIARRLGLQHVQCGWEWSGEENRGRSFYYRSFFFLALAAAVANSWGATRIYQFENGVLATAIPPSPWFMMTRHADPRLQALAEQLFESLFGGKWEVLNPFLKLTKRQCVEAAQRDDSDIVSLLQQTETCWSYHSMPKIGKKRKPRRRACGICIPCILRRTALSEEGYYKDLLKDSVRNETKLGIPFRSYFGFLERVLRTRKSRPDFYRILPGEGRMLLDETQRITLPDVQALFTRFANEFMETYRIEI